MHACMYECMYVCMYVCIPVGACVRKPVSMKAERLMALICPQRGVYAELHLKPYVDLQ